jgi:hypothetical protein
MSARTLRKKVTKPSGTKAAKFSVRKATKPSGKKAEPSRKKAAAASRKKAVAPARRRTSPAFSGKRNTASPRRAAALLETPATEEFNEFVAWVNETYQLQLPTLADFAPGTLLYEMWSVTVEVTKNPSPGVAARARAKTSLILVAKLSGLVFMDIRQASVAGAARSNSRR